MSYGKPTQLIARSGYGAASDYIAVGADLYVGKHGSLYEPTGGVLDKIGDFLKGAGSGVLNYYNTSQQTKGQADLLAAQQAAAAQSSTPSWLLPAVIVGGGVLLVMMLKKPRSNPARGYRRRRRRSRRRSRR